MFMRMLNHLGVHTIWALNRWNYLERPSSVLHKNVCQSSKPKSHSSDIKVKYTTARFYIPGLFHQVTTSC